MKAVLAVSFGTTVDETREKTIGAVERELAEAFPEHQLFRAFTSQKIVKALKKTGKVLSARCGKPLMRSQREGQMS